MSQLQLTGIHHLTAVTSQIRENKRFYTDMLGLRMVKRTVNQDDTSAYHLFYADGVGNPGTDITFFDWPLAREQRGSRTVTRTGLRVRDLDSLNYWQGRLGELQVSHGDIRELDGRPTLDFEDTEGQRLRLVVDGGAGDAPAVWERSAVPAEHQLRGLGPITITVPDLRNTDLVLQKVLHMRPVRDYADPESADSTHRVHVYEMGAGGSPDKELHVAVRPDLPVARPGAGSVHHVAFRVPDEEQYHAWTEHLWRMGMQTSGEVDRYWFRSLYFREPNGVLFELATDGPGFGVDEDMDRLGETLILPPFLEQQRPQIEAGLKPID